jgi:hypothetical protein
MAKLPIPAEWGPQFAGDDAFTKKCRLLQSWYRYTILKEEQFGIGPEKNSRNRYGNMLVDGGLTGGGNFLSPDIFEYAKFRKAFEKNGETIREYRLFNNMLSSQTMCFNLFFPLKRLFERDVKSANAVLAKCFPELQILRVLALEIELFPYPNTEYLNDGTAFDAFMVYEDMRHNRNVLAIETKYREPLGDNCSRDLQPQIELAAQTGFFNEEGMQRVRDGLPQLGRNYLLALKYSEVHKLDMAFEVVISPSENKSTIKEITRFRHGLTSDIKDMVYHKTLENLLAALEENAPRKYSRWIADFNTRYLDFTPITNYI